MGEFRVPVYGDDVPDPLWHTVKALRRVIEQCEESLRLLSRIDWDDVSWPGEVVDVNERWAVRSRVLSLIVAAQDVRVGLSAAELLAAAIGEDEEA